MKKETKRAFTLIELLVVIAVIVILAGLLLPALGKAKAKSQQIVCLNKLRQWTIALLIYKDENDDWLPREKCVARIHTWADISDPRNGDVWFNVLPPAYLGHKSVAEYAMDPEGFHSGKNIFQCPAARLPSGQADPTFTLALNSKLNSSTNVLERLKFNCIQSQNESQTVLFLDCGVTTETQLFPTQKPYYGQPSAWANRLSGRHNGGANLAFADAHARWFSGADVVDSATGANVTNNAAVLWSCP